MAGLGKKTFAAGEVLRAADVNGYLMEQSVMSFANTAARGSAIGTPSQGMSSFIQDTGALETYFGAYGTANVGGRTPAGWYKTNQVRGQGFATIDTSQTTASISYTDLATVGPVVTLETGTSALVLISCISYEGSGSIAYTSFAVSGATTVAANDSWSAWVRYNNQISGGLVYRIDNLNPGSNTFTMKFRSGNSTAAFSYRKMQVIAL